MFSPSLSGAVASMSSLAAATLGLLVLCSWFSLRRMYEASLRQSYLPQRRAPKAPGAVASASSGSLAALGSPAAATAAAPTAAGLPAADASPSITPVPSGPQRSLKLMVVLGSGGHTAEMLRMLSPFGGATASNSEGSGASLISPEAHQLFSHRTYIAADSDLLSLQKARQHELTLAAGLQQERSFSGLATPARETKASFHTIPRSRNVGQSYISSIFTTLNALLFSIFLIWSEQPDMLVCNGPGTCLPLVFVAKLLRILHLGHCRVVFVESVARVNTLSLTGRIFSTLRLADRFVVHWAQLAGPNSNIHPKPEYFGLLV